MIRRALSLVVIASVIAVGFGSAVAQEKAATVDNPYYAGWKDFKEKTTATHEEKTVYHGDAAKDVPADGDVKIVTYALSKVNPDNVVVTTTVVDYDFLSTIESAKTKITYPAKVNKANFEALLHKADAKLTDAKVTVMGKEVAAKVVTTSTKSGNEETDRKFTFSFAIPGGLIEKTTKVKVGGKLVAETTVTLKSYKVAE